MSKLHVEICKIKKIEDLSNADKLQMATVKDWQCLIRKNQYKEGQLIIFVPPDAILPDNLIEELKLEYLKGKNRIKTVKLRGYISQGLILPTDILKKYDQFCYGENDLSEGEDVAKILGITKYKPPVKVIGIPTPKNIWIKIRELWKGVIIGKVKFNFAFKQTMLLIKNRLMGKKKVNLNFNMYTDIDNIKHYLDIFKEGEDVVITEKIHGCNARFACLPLNKSLFRCIKQFFTGKKYEFVYGSHRVQKTALSGEDVYGQIAERYQLKDIIPEDFILYGEIYGKKIQSLTYGLNDSIDVVFFDIKHKGKYLDWEVFYFLCIMWGLPIVPICYLGPYNKEIVKKHTEAKNTIITDENGQFVKQIREGCVIKPTKETYSNRCGRKILKSINPEYLLTKKQDHPEEVIDDNAEFPH